MGDFGATNAYHSTSNPTATYQIRFVMPGDPEIAYVPPVEFVHESVVNQDLNRDGDMSDHFAISSLVFLRNDQSYGPGNPRLLAGRCTIEVSASNAPIGRIFRLDAEPFSDLNGNNIYEEPELETYTDENGNGRWDAKLEIEIRAIDDREKKGRVRAVKTKINYFRNAI
ncbi:MAG: hypothetical protein M5U26_28525 [Planctomycetota bacterium]|nr:hypothetical protein [Planctomycetota bacterium]